MAEYIDKSAEVYSGYLTDWYINSVAEYDDEKLNEPRWTEKHIEELTNDFIVIPKDTPTADVAPVVHGRWVYGEFDIPHCSECGNDVMPNMISPYCPNCGAKMDEEVK